MTIEEAMKHFPPMWTVYDHPKDWPHGFLARKWYGECPTSEVLAAPTLETLRWELEERGFIPLARDPGDDPCIVETWI